MIESFPQGLPKQNLAPINEVETALRSIVEIFKKELAVDDEFDYFILPRECWNDFELLEKRVGTLSSAGVRNKELYTGRYYSIGNDGMSVKKDYASFLLNRLQKGN